MYADNREKLERLAKLAAEIDLAADNGKEKETEKLGEEYNKIFDSLTTVEEMFEKFSNEYNNAEKGQRGNGYYLTGSNDLYIDFIYGENDEGESVVLRYLVDEDFLNEGEVLVKAWIE